MSIHNYGKSIFSRQNLPGAAREPGKTHLTVCRAQRSSPRRAEHPRSYGTAGSAARKSCCVPLLGMTGQPWRAGPFRRMSKTECKFNFVYDAEYFAKQIL